MARLLDALSSSSDATGHAFSGGVSVYSPADVPMTEDLRGLIRAAIEETSARGDVVIVSHAASHALAANTDVLRVLVTASRETRTARLVESVRRQRGGRRRAPSTRPMPQGPTT